MCRAKFCYYTNAKSHYPRVQSDLCPRPRPHLTKSQVQQMKGWRIKANKAREKCFTQTKTVRNMSTKDKPSTLSINLYLTEQPTCQTFELGKITEVYEETAVTPRLEEGEKRSSDLVQLS